MACSATSRLFLVRSLGKVAEWRGVQVYPTSAMPQELLRDADEAVSSLARIVPY
jgi:hypothetical protein